MQHVDLNTVFSYLDEHESRLHEIIKSLVEKPSGNPPGHTTEAAEVAASLLSSNGFTVELVKATEKKVNVVAQWNMGQEETILFNGHLDTVPIGDSSLWRFNPYGAETSEGWMYGRGVADDKGAVGCLLAACEAIRSLGLKPRTNIMIHAVCDEEVGSKLGTSYLVEKGYANKATYGYVLEASTSKNRIFVRNSMKGTASLTITVEGKTAHAANPYDGVNANLEMSKLLLALSHTKFKYKRSRYLTPPTIASGTVMQGGEKSNVIPGKCISSSDIRYLPGMTEETMRRDIDRVINQIRRKDKKLRLSYELKLGDHKAVEIGQEQPVVRKAGEMITRVTGYKPRVMGGYGATDASILVLGAKVPTLIGLGPADIDVGNMHGINEKVSTARLMDYTKIYAGLIMSS
jgi:succinyl-diaminopimelate desuccinylase